MKYWLISSLSLIFFYSVNLFSQDVGDFANQYSNVPNVSVYYIDSTQMAEDKSFGWLDRIPLTGTVDSLVVTDLSQCELKTQQEFKAGFIALSDTPEYQTVLKTNRIGEQVRVIIFKPENNIIKNIYIFVSDDKSQIYIVKIIGEMSRVDLSYRDPN